MKHNVEIAYAQFISRITWQVSVKFYTDSPHWKLGSIAFCWLSRVLLCLKLKFNISVFSKATNYSKSLSIV
jgi:hypothetical protein